MERELGLWQGCSLLIVVFERDRRSKSFDSFSMSGEKGLAQSMVHRLDSVNHALVSPPLVPAVHLVSFVEYAFLYLIDVGICEAAIYPSYTTTLSLAKLSKSTSTKSVTERDGTA